MSYYVGICSENGKAVGEDDAFTYAMCRVMENKDEQEAFVEWYYSGNWLKSEEGEN